MAYNLALFSERQTIEARFGARFSKPRLFRPMYHASGFTGPLWPVILGTAADLITLVRWGLVPGWAQDRKTADKMRFKTFNARSETIHDKPAFKHSIRSGRCLVIVDGFFEWRDFEGRKYPHFIGLTNPGPFALAGISDVWTDHDTGQSEATFSILTCTANSFVARIHNVRKRMPVILELEEERSWLADGLSEQDLDSLLKPFNSDEMQAHPVSRLISQRGVDKNVPEAVERFEYPELKA